MCLSWFAAFHHVSKDDDSKDAENHQHNLEGADETVAPYLGRTWYKGGVESSYSIIEFDGFPRNCHLHIYRQGMSKRIRTSGDAKKPTARRLLYLAPQYPQDGTISPNIKASPGRLMVSFAEVKSSVWL